MIVASILDLSGINSLIARRMFNDLPKEIRKHVGLIKSTERKKHSLGGYVLLKYLYKTFFKGDMPRVGWTKDGKPYFEDSEVSFSISHDGDFCAVLMSDDYENVGIDIQSVPSSLRVFDRLARRILAKSVTQKVKEIIDDAPNAGVLYHRLSEKGIESVKQNECEISGRERDFLFAWTTTEATLKSVGEGLAKFKHTEEYIKDAKIGFNVFMDKMGKKYVTCGVVKNVKQPNFKE